jgi:hypothetical protein
MVNKSNLIYDKWNSWSSKSKDYSFEYKEQGIGDGEFKLGAEYGVKPLGQNENYDLLINGEKWEVKKLDLDGSFRLGVEAQNEYFPIQMKLLQIFNAINIINSILSNRKDDQIKIQIQKIWGEKINEKFGTSKTTIYEGLIKSEISESNLNMLNSILNELVDIIKLPNSLQKIEITDPEMGLKKQISLEKYYSTLKSFGKSEEFLNKKLGNDYSLILVKSMLNELMNDFEKDWLENTLNNVIRNIFHDKILVLVHKTDGYKPIKKIKNIRCYRVTHGNPRVKYNEN